MLAHGAKTICSIPQTSSHPNMTQKAKEHSACKHSRGLSGLHDLQNVPVAWSPPGRQGDLGKKCLALGAWKCSRISRFLSSATAFPAKTFFSLAEFGQAGRQAHTVTGCAHLLVFHCACVCACFVNFINNILLWSVCLDTCNYSNDIFSPCPHGSSLFDILVLIPAKAHPISHIQIVCSGHSEPQTLSHRHPYKPTKPLLTLRIFFPF